jgi:indole-3-glycerol phosphate synthase
VTRIGFVAKSWCFSTQNSDEIRSRRQKMKLSDQKRRRERASSPKNEAFCPKTTTKIGLVAKKKRFSPQNGDEIWFRRQNRAFFGSKW